MKKPLLLLLTLALLPALAENYYDRNGSYQGRTENDRNGNMRFYDRNGSYQGKQENGRFYDRNGAYRGQKH